MRKFRYIMLAAGLSALLAACGAVEAVNGKKEEFKDQAVSAVTGVLGKDGEEKEDDGSGKTDEDRQEPEEKEKEPGTETAQKSPVSLDDAKEPAARDFDYDNFTSYVDLRGYHGKDEVILIPTEIEGLPVQCDNLVLAESTAVRGIVFEEGYTSLPNVHGTGEEAVPVEAVRIPASCTELPDKPTNPFSNLPSLRTIEVADGNPVYLTEDGILYAMRSESKLLLCYPAMKEGETYVQPEGTFLASNAFAGNRFLKRVEEANPWVEGSVFVGSAVEEVVCSEKWTYLGQHSFSDYSGESRLRSITLSAALDSHAGKVDLFAGLDCLEEIIVPEGNAKYFSEDGVLYWISEKYNGVYLMLYPNARPGEEFTPSERADGIAYVDLAFDNPLYLKKIHAANMDVQGVSFPNGIEVVTP